MRQVISCATFCRAIKCRSTGRPSKTPPRRLWLRRRAAATRSYGCKTERSPCSRPCVKSQKQWGCRSHRSEATMMSPSWAAVRRGWPLPSTAHRKVCAPCSSSVARPAAKRVSHHTSKTISAFPSAFPGTSLRAARFVKRSASAQRSWSRAASTLSRQYPRASTSTAARGFALERSFSRSA